MLDASKITGEICTCGHKKIEHYSIAEEHEDHGGHCKRCACPRFTWAAFLDAEGNKIT